jgi:hypothetical protein
MNPGFRTSDGRLKAALAEQVDFLRASAERFDAGHQHEAKRLALTIRVLLHDTASSKSLLEQLDLKSSLAFLDTRTRRQPPAGVPALEQLGWPTGMVVLAMATNGPTTFRAALDSDQTSSPRVVAIDSWWGGRAARFEGRHQMGSSAIHPRRRKFRRRRACRTKASRVVAGP